MSTLWYICVFLRIPCLVRFQFQTTLRFPQEPRSWNRWIEAGCGGFVQSCWMLSVHFALMVCLLFLFPVSLDEASWRASCQSISILLTLVGCGRLVLCTDQYFAFDVSNWPEWKVLSLLCKLSGPGFGYSVRTQLSGYTVIVDMA